MRGRCRSGSCSTDTRSASTASPTAQVARCSRPPGLDDTVRVWDPSTGRLLRVWHDPRPVTGIAFSFDGSRIVTGAALGTIRIWDACTACTNPRELLSIARGRVTRQLTTLERATFLTGLLSADRRATELHLQLV